MSEKYWGWEVWSEDGLFDYGKADTEKEAEGQCKAAELEAKRENRDGVYGEVDLYWSELHPLDIAIKEDIPQMFDERIAKVQQQRESPDPYCSLADFEEVLRDLRAKVLKAMDRL